jgi:hypothetical protein
MGGFHVTSTIACSTEGQMSHACYVLTNRMDGLIRLEGIPSRLIQRTTSRLAVVLAAAAVAGWSLCRRCARSPSQESARRP